LWCRKEMSTGLKLLAVLKRKKINRSAKKEFKIFFNQKFIFKN